MSEPMTLSSLRERRPGAHRWAVGGMVGVLALGLNIPSRRVRFAVEGFEQLPDSPVLFAGNHTHYLDWIALRWTCFLRGRMQANWVKPSTYEHGLGTFLDLTGNIPLASRGFLLAADARRVAGRAPTSEEYRMLRDHLDSGSALPDTELVASLMQGPRDMLGLLFDPAQQSWREAQLALFTAMMQATLAHTRRLNGEGVDLTVMPQGVIHPRLTRGHPGALQAALALGISLVPVGVSGFPQAFGDTENLPKHGGTITVRFGAPYTPAPIAGHEPFVPASERVHAEAIAAGTQDLMERINALLDPAHQWAEDPSEGPSGVELFT